MWIEPALVIGIAKRFAQESGKTEEEEWSRAWDVAYKMTQEG
jgi:hypothetical protein